MTTTKTIPVIGLKSTSTTNSVLIYSKSSFYGFDIIKDGGQSLKVLQCFENNYSELLSQQFNQQLYGYLIKCTVYQQRKTKEGIRNQLTQDQNISCYLIKQNFVWLSQERKYNAQDCFAVPPRIYMKRARIWYYQGIGLNAYNRGGSLYSKPVQCITVRKKIGCFMIMIKITSSIMIRLPFTGIIIFSGNFSENTGTIFTSLLI